MWFAEWLSILSDTFLTYYPFKINSKEFTLSLCLLCLGTVLFGKIITGLLCDSKRGLIMVFLGMLNPFILAIAGYTATIIYINPFLPYDWMALVLKYSVAGLVAIFSIIFISPFFLGLGFIKSFISMTFTYLFTIALVSYGTPFFKGIIFDKKPLPSPDQISQIDIKYYKNST